jgi:hypothetical protein
LNGDGMHLSGYDFAIAEQNRKPYILGARLCS